MSSNQFITAAILFVCSWSATIPARAQSLPSAQELIAAAHARSDLALLGPYVLTADIEVIPLDKKGKPAEEKRRLGKLTVYRDHERSRIDVRFGKASDTEILIGETQYINPHGSLVQPLGLAAFDRSWDPEPWYKPAAKIAYDYTPVSRQRVGDIETLCFDRQHSKQVEYLCFDGARSVLLSRADYEFSDYASTGKVQFPQTAKIWRKDGPVVRVLHIAVAPQTLGQEIFHIPASTIAIEPCDHPQPPVPISTPPPDFFSAAQLGQQGMVRVNVIITAEGKVVGAYVANSVGSGLGRDAADGVKSWRFKPATCNGRPVNTAMTFEVSFDLRH